MRDPEGLNAALDSRLRNEGARVRALRAGCPDPDLLMARDSEVLDQGVRQRLHDHLSTCEACCRLATDIDALALHQADDATARRVRHRHALPNPGLRRVRLSAASLLVATGLGLTWWALRTAPSPVPVVEDHGVASPAPAVPTSVVSLWDIQPAAVRLPLSSLGEGRGPGDPGQAGLALVEALEPYQSGQYREAAERLDVVTRNHPSSGEAHFYLGVAQLLTGQPELAAASLDHAARRLPQVRQLEVAWYRATAEQRSGRVGAAKAFLQKVCAASGPHQAAACAAETRLQ